MCDGVYDFYAYKKATPFMEWLSSLAYVALCFFSFS